jgi:hypothetical protein
VKAEHHFAGRHNVFKAFELAANAVKRAWLAAGSRCMACSGRVHAQPGHAACCWATETGEVSATSYSSPTTAEDVLGGPRLVDVTCGMCRCSSTGQQEYWSTASWIRR